MMTNRQKVEGDRRILVLGSANHTKLVTAYDWDKLPKNLNVSDFDTVILNFTPFQASDFAESVNVDLVPAWRQFARLIFSADSEVIAIGSPNFRLGSNPYILSDWWLPVDPLFVYETGHAIREVADGFAFYFAVVRSWTFYLQALGAKQPEFVSNYAAIADPQANSISLKIKTSLAETRFQRSIGFAMWFTLYRHGNPVKDSGAVSWLPETTEVSAVEAIDLILRERHGLQFESTPPDWIGDFSLPSQLPINQEIHDKGSAILDLTTQLETAKRRLVEATRFQKLLYEQGEDALEPIVRDVLRELGASVDEPKQRGREDGRLIDSFSRQGMLEVKGRTGSLRLSDVRELDQWVRDAVADEGWESKGILVVNLQCQQDPRDRREFIPTNCASAAARFDISIVTTTQLFQAMVADQQGDLDRKQFWDSVFAAKGICDLPDRIQSKNTTSPAS
jgi:hypothetical protein